MLCFALLTCKPFVLFSEKEWRGGGGGGGGGGGREEGEGENVAVMQSSRWMVGGPEIGGKDKFVGPRGGGGVCAAL